MVFNWLHMAILLFLAGGFALAAAMLLMPFFMAPRAKSPQMGMAYECGMVPVGGAWIRLHINYYVYALIFIAFEVDVLYLFPVALYYPAAPGFVDFLKVFVFLFVLVLAVVYFRAKGVFRWPRRIQ